MTVLPVQIILWLEAAETIGKGITVIVVVTLELQLPLLPIAVYTVVADGVTTIGLPVIEPGNQVKLGAPTPKRPTVNPAHTVGLEALMDIAGEGLTVTVIFAVPLQPDPFDPITEYTVVTEGVTTMEAKLAPLLQV